MIQGGIVGGTYGIDGGGGKNPVSYYYGKSQTKRLGQNYTPAGAGNSRAAEFKATADETYDGGKSDLLTIINGSAATNIDITSAPNNSVIQFPAGRYHLLFVGYSDASSRTGFRVELRKIQSGTDDLLITRTEGWTNAVSPAETTYSFFWTDFVVDGTEQFYLLFPDAGNMARSHYLRVEKVA